MAVTRTILIFGAAGQLGQSLLKVAEERREIRCIGLKRADVDVTERRQVDNAIRKFEAHVVVNCAAMTDVDGCERNPMLAAAVNAEGAGLVARACQAANAELVHVSTDFVFDGTTSRPLGEDDPTRPLNVYGTTKLEGERTIRRVSTRHLIVRTAWTFGPGPANFVTKILERARRDGTVSVVRTQTGSPSHTMDVARGIFALVFAHAHGTFHVVNEGVATRIELAQAALELAGLGSVRVEPLDAPPPAADGGATAARPAYSALDPARFAAKAGFRLPPWRDALKEYLATP